MINIMKKLLDRIRQVLQSNEGFTMMELMVVVTIIAILSAGAIIIGRRAIQNAKVKTAKMTIKQLDTLIATLTEIPDNETGLQAVVDEGLIRRESLRDPWGKPYNYQYPGTRGEYDIWSYGSDGQEGGDGFAKDIGNWSEESEGGQ